MGTQRMESEYARRMSGVLVGCLAVGLVWASSLFAQPEQAVPQPPAAPTRSVITRLSHTAQTAEQHEEVVAFMLQGKQPWEVLGIDDLSTIVTADQVRYVSIRELLTAIRANLSEKDGVYTFTLDGNTPVSLNPGQHEITVGGETSAIDAMIALSTVTHARDLYLLPADIERLFQWQLSWDEQRYAYLGHTDRSLLIWKPIEGRSLLSIKTKDIPLNLPELLPTAKPRKTSLSYFQFATNTRASIAETDGTPQQFTMDTIEQTFWGNLANGQFKATLREPAISISDDGIRTRDDDPLVMSWIDWKYRWKASELVAGDSTVSFSDLVFPYLRLSGMRVNGLTGRDANDLPKPEAGLRRDFPQQQSFEGIAPLGSTVDLYVNDHLLDSTVTQEASSDAGAGMGRWSFTDVDLPRGNLNSIRFLITDLQGNKTEVEREVLGTSQLLGKGKLGYLGAIGTNRNTNGWDVTGLFAGGRMMYGINDRLTVGTSAGLQSDLYRGFADTSLYSLGYDTPASSAHLGTEITWLPTDRLLVSSDLAMCATDDSDVRKGTNDTAFRIKSDLYPANRVKLSAQLFKYGTNYFTGQRSSIADRQGFVASSHWQWNKNWMMDLGVGSVGNNVNGERASDLRVAFQNLTIKTSTIPHASLSFEMNRLAPNDGSPEQTLGTISLQYRPQRDLLFYGIYSTGDRLSVPGNVDFFRGLRLPGMSLYEAPRTSLLLSKNYAPGQRLALSYWENDSHQQVSLIHNTRLGLHRHSSRPFYLQTEVGQDIDENTPFLTNRLEWQWDQANEKRITLESRYDNDGLTISLVSNAVDLFAFDSWGKAQRVPGRTISPELGAVHGTVFADYNANGIRDAGEPPISNIRVSDENRLGVVTDKKGYFILPASSPTWEERVFLDMKSIPAIYSPTHAIQTVQAGPGDLTEVNLGIVPVAAVAGIIIVQSTPTDTKPLSGVHVYLVKPGSTDLLAESYTAADGEYYLGDIKPGKYQLIIDPNSIPKDAVVPKFEDIITIQPKDDAQHIELSPLKLLMGTAK